MICSTVAIHPDVLSELKPGARRQNLSQVITATSLSMVAIESTEIKVGAQGYGAPVEPCNGAPSCRGF